MRYPVVSLVLLVVLPVINVRAAPVPDPSAVLALAPPPKRETPEQFYKDQREGQTSIIMLGRVLSDPEVSKLPLIARMNDPCSWLARNLQVTAEKGGSPLRFNFRAGSRAEQAAILNALLRANLYWQELSIKFGEDIMCKREKDIGELERRIQAAKNPQEVAAHQEGIHNLRTKYIPELQAEIARRKQEVVIRWAR